MTLDPATLFKDNDPRTWLLKADQANQYLCCPCNKHINANEAGIHTTSPGHAKAVQVMQLIDQQKLAVHGLTRKNVTDLAMGQQVRLPVAQKLHAIEQKYNIRVEIDDNPSPNTLSNTPLSPECYPHHHCPPECFRYLLSLIKHLSSKLLGIYSP